MSALLQNCLESRDHRLVLWWYGRSLDTRRKRRLRRRRGGGKRRGGRREVEGGRWKEGGGRREVEGARWKEGGGRREVEGGRWKEGGGRREVEGGRKEMENERRKREVEGERGKGGGGGGERERGEKGGRWRGYRGSRVAVHMTTLRLTYVNEQGNTTNLNVSIKQRAAQVGLEPTTYCLLGRCSTTKLPRYSRRQ